MPIAGKAVGTTFGGPLGGMAGGMAGAQATQLFGLELEGMSYEDQEFEVAKRFVRMAGDTVKTAAKLEGRMPPDKAANTAFKTAARKHAPGLLKPARRKAAAHRRSRVTDTGRWMRYGNRIVLFGLKDA